jgi:hypothetical protein
MRRLTIRRYEDRCPDAPHVNNAPFYFTLCLGRIMIHLRKWSR